MRLEEILLRSGAVDQERLDAALRSQVVHGGRLGTNLVVLGYVSVEALTDALSMYFGVRGILPAQLDRVPLDTIELMRRQTAETYEALPLGLTSEGAANRSTAPRSRLGVAMTNPRNLVALDELAFATGYSIEPYVAAELVVEIYLEKFYGVRRPDRRISRGTRSAAATSPSQRSSQGTSRPDSKTLQSRSSERPPVPAGAFATGARHQPHATSRVASEEDDGIDLVVDVAEWGHRESYLGRAIEARLPEIERRVGDSRPALSIDDALVRLQGCSSKEAIGDTVIDYLRSTFGCGLILIVRDELALGWKGGSATGLDPAIVEAIALPLTFPSMFRSAYERQTMFRGAPPANGEAIQLRFWKLLRTAPPAEVVVVPVVLGARVVNLIYAHAFDGGCVPGAAVQEVIAIAKASGQAYVKLIKTQRK